MKRTKKRLAVCIALLVMILGFIWGNSALPATESSQVSGGLLAFLGEIFPFLLTENGEYVLRKLAHFSEFAALGACFAWLFGMFRKKAVWPMLCGIGAACVDEVIQIFSPGRSSSMVDVLLDSAGVLTGVLLLVIIVKYKKTGCS